jgi:hypothetical protein
VIWLFQTLLAAMFSTFWFVWAFHGSWIRPLSIPANMLKLPAEVKLFFSPLIDYVSFLSPSSFFFAGLVYSTISLFSTVVFLILAAHFNGWKLDRKLGIVLLIWYFIFMIFASMYELNVFGNANPPTCDSDY